MQHEAAGRLDEAQQVYDSILQEDESNMVKINKNRIGVYIQLYYYHYYHYYYIYTNS